MITWDEKKRRERIEDHGIDFEKIANLFDDPFAIYTEDDAHSDFEERWLIIARSSEYGLLAASYTFRDEDIRLVTARRAERWMERLYEQQRNRT